MNTQNTKDYLVTVGERLRGVRLLKGITQKQAAADTDMSQSFLSSVERGQKSACTAQIITLIRYYNVPYEMIFGEMDGNYSMDGFPESKAGLKHEGIYYELLYSLAGKANSDELIVGADNCLKICAYILFRTIYRENPRNSDRLFSIDYETALHSAMIILTKSPDNISRFIRKTRSIKADRFELPPERNSELRVFIKECETMLTSVDSGSDFPHKSNV